VTHTSSYVSLIVTENDCKRTCGDDTTKKRADSKNDDNNRQHGGVVKEGDDDKDEGNRNSPFSLVWQSHRVVVSSLSLSMECLLLTMMGERGQSSAARIAIFYEDAVVIS
jgi:hypothetical protein